MLLKYVHDQGYLAIQFEIEDENFKIVLEALEWFVSSYWYYLAFVPIINIVLTYIIGKYVLSGLLYPYQNSIGREALDRSNSTRFSEEFEHFLECLAYTLRI